MTKLLSILFIWTIFSIHAQAQINYTDLEKQQWQEDFDFLYEQIKLKHFNAFTHTGMTAFEKAKAEMRGKMINMDASEIIVSFLRLAALIGDGHTFVNTDKAHHYYPVRFFWFGDDLRVVQATEAQKELLGAKVTKIGSLDLKAADEKMKEVIAQVETANYHRHRSAQYFSVAEILKGLGISDKANEATFEVVTSGGETKTASLKALSSEEYGSASWQWAYNKAPLFLQNQEKEVWDKKLDDTTKMYVNMASFNSSNYGSTSKNITTGIADLNVRTLILDLRLNSDANGKKMEGLLKQIQKSALVAENGQVYIIVGRANFAGATHAAVKFSEEMGAIVIGEPIGSMLNGFQENRPFTLPASKFNGSTAKKKYNAYKKDKLHIGQEILPSWEEYMKGNDPALDWILAR